LPVLARNLLKPSTLSTCKSHVSGSNHYLITGFRAESPNYVAKIRKEYSLVEKGE
jgi:hypothetical protein